MKTKYLRGIKMRFLILTALLFLTSLAAKLYIEPVLPDFLYFDPFLWWVVFWALFSKDKQSSLPAFFVGLLKDLLSSGALGIYAILYALVFRLIAKSKHKLFIENKYTQMLLVFGAGLIVNFLYFVLMVLNSGNYDLVSGMLRILCIIVPTALLTLPAFEFIDFLSKLLRIRQNKRGQYLLPDY